MSPSATTKFTAAARVLAQRAAELDLVVPGFRSPPRIVGVNRSIRRSRDSEGGVVAVRLSDRPFTAAVGDMIEGVIFINRLEPPKLTEPHSVMAHHVAVHGGSVEFAPCSTARPRHDARSLNMFLPGWRNRQTQGA